MESLNWVKGKAKDKVSEVGLSLLDTREIKSTPPGANGAGWVQHMRCYHYRIRDWDSPSNRPWFKDRHGYPLWCPTNFEFDVSEFVADKDIARVLTEKLKIIDKTLSTPGNTRNRTIILVGHAWANEDRYFKAKLGMDLASIGTIARILDTQVLGESYDAYSGRDITPSLRTLVSSKCGISATHMHNGGNDAAYTLLALLAIGLRHAKNCERVIPAGGPEDSMADAVGEFKKRVLRENGGRCTRCDVYGHNISVCRVAQREARGEGWERKPAAGCGRGRPNGNGRSVRAQKVVPFDLGGEPTIGPW